MDLIETLPLDSRLRTSGRPRGSEIPVECALNQHARATFASTARGSRRNGALETMRASTIRDWRLALSRVSRRPTRSSATVGLRRENVISTAVGSTLARAVRERGPGRRQSPNLPPTLLPSRPMSRSTNFCRSQTRRRLTLRRQFLRAVTRRPVGSKAATSRKQPTNPETGSGTT